MIRAVESAAEREISLEYEDIVNGDVKISLED